MRRLSFGLAFFGSIMLCASAGAQKEGRRLGSWAFEGGISAAPILLHFRSPSSARAFGLTAQYTRSESERSLVGGGTTADTDENTVVDLRVGLREYRSVTRRVERFWTVSGTVGLEQNSLSGSGPRLGASGDMGAAYFFTPRVSLGGIGRTQRHLLEHGWRRPDFVAKVADGAFRRFATARRRLLLTCQGPSAPAA
jgi:hypothetical protein